MSSYRICRAFKVLGMFLLPFFFVAVSLAAGSSEALIAKLDCPDRVNAVAFSPNGQFLAAGYGWNNQGGLKIWSMADRTVVWTWATPQKDKSSEGIDEVAFSLDGKFLAAATSIGDVLIWKVGTWGEPRRIILKAGRPSALVFSSDDKTLALSSEFAVFYCNLMTWNSRKLRSRADPAEEFIVAGFSADGRELAVCRAAAIQWWDVDTGKVVKNWAPHGLGFFCSLSSDRDYLVAGGGAILTDKNVEVLNASDGKPLAGHSGFRSGLFASALSHSGQWIALGGGSYGSGGDLSLWSLRDLHEIGFVSVGRLPIQGLAFSPDDSVLAAGSHDGVVLLYAVDRLRGPQRTKQTVALCGEVSVEGDKAYIVPVSKGPTPMSRDFDYGWKLEVAEPGNLVKFAGLPVVLQDWEIESNAAMDKARVNNFTSISSKPAAPDSHAEYAVFGDVRNPGWNKGFIVKVYGDESFMAASNSGECLAYGSLSTTTTPNFDALKGRLLSEGLLSVPRDPLTLGADHFRTRFIALFGENGLGVRSDVEEPDSSKSRTHPANKAKQFTRIFEQEEPFINSLLQAGMHSFH